MAIVETAKELLNKMEELSGKKYVLNRISKVMRLMAAIVLVSIFLSDKLNLDLAFLKVDLDLWDEVLRIGLKNNIYRVCIFWIIYELIISNVLRRGCILFDKTECVESLPILFTLDDLIDFVCSLYFFVYAMNQLIELNSTISSGDMTMSIIAGIYLFIVFVNWLYIKNRCNWYDIHREYTNYYDVTNKRIPKNANVIYRGKLYRVRQDAQSQEWRLVSYDKDSLSLEEAAKDRDGNITIDTRKS